MAGKPAFDIYSTGSVAIGFDEADVISRFAELFNCSEQDARKYATSNMLMRKNVDQVTAAAYARTLEEMGFGVRVTPRQPVIDEVNHEAHFIDPTRIDPSGIDSNEATNDTARNPREELARSRAHIKLDDDEERSTSSATAFIGPIIGSVLAIIIWVAVSTLLHSRFDFMPVIAGALVGGGASITKLKGKRAAIGCGALVVVAALVSISMPYALRVNDYTAIDTSNEIPNLDAMHSDPHEAFVASMQQQAYVLSNIPHTDENLASFMRDYDYANSSTDPITAAEIDEFRALGIEKLGFAFVAMAIAFHLLNPITMLMLICGVFFAYRMASDEI